MKYSIGQTVKIKATGEKVKIQKIREITPWIAPIHEYIYMCNETWYEEDQLKKYAPSRTGTRDPKTGRFVSKRKGFGCTYCQECFWSDKELHEHIEEHFNPDSKHRNYQKITKLNDSIHNYVSTTVLIETMLFKINEIIDELGRRV